METDRSEAHKPFFDFIDHAVLPDERDPSYALCMAYAMQASDLIGSRNELIRLAGLPAPYEAWRYNWLGIAHGMLGQQADAEACFAAAIEHNPDNRLKFQVYKNWGGCVTSNNSQNDPEIARRAITILESGLQLDPPDGVRIRLRASLAINLKILGRYDEAIQVFHGVREYSLTTGDPLFIAMATSDLADLYRIKGQFDQAKAYALAAWETVKDVETIANDRFGILEILTRLLRDAGDFKESLAYTSIAIGMAEEARAQAVTERDRVDWFSVLRTCYDDALLCYLALNDTSSAFDMTERARARAFAEISGAEKPVTFATVSLPNDLAIVSYYIVTGRLWAFVLGQGDIEVVDLCPVEDVENAFDATGYPRNLLPGAKGKLRKAFVLDRLADLIARPLDHLVAGYDRLCLIPYGPLHHMPITMMFQNAHTFVSPSVTMLKNSKPRHDYVEVVAVGYNDGTLNHAEAEAQAVGDIVLTGKDATKSAILNSATGARCLHISAHGFFDPKEPGRSYVQLSDGPLFGDEIAEQLRLESALVVLSSCDSGRSRIHPGDEPFGLIRSFIKAGARTVVCSLWPVDEVATRLLMEYFYKNIRAGMRAAGAIRQAQDTIRSLPKSELREQLAMPGIPKGASQEIAAKTDDDLPFSHPYWWAGFVVVGDEFTQ